MGGTTWERLGGWSKDCGLYGKLCTWSWNTGWCHGFGGIFAQSRAFYGRSSDLQEIKEQLSDDSLSRALVRALQKESRELEERIENPVGELKTSFDEVKTEMRKIFKSIEEENLALSEDISRMKDVISQTFLLVADVKYRVS